MKIKTVTSNLMGNNSYILISDNEAVVIDPSFNEEEILSYLEKLNLKYIVLTHMHADHIYSTYSLKKKTGCKVLAGEKSSFNLIDKNIRLDDLVGCSVELFDIDYTVKEGEPFPFGSDEFTIIDTKGHTTCSISILCNDYLFTGDTMFKEAHGRVDFETSNINDMNNSLSKLLKLDDNIIVMPGHGESTTIKGERRHYGK